jgi:ATP-binding protein involved in chromosome partitioning
MIENMSTFVCPHCHETTSIFLSGGVEREAEKHNIPVLGSVPLDGRICYDADKGKPSVVQEDQEGNSRGQIFRDIAESVLGRLISNESV